MDLTIPAEWSELTRTTRDFTGSEIEPISRTIEDEDEIPASVPPAAPS